MPRTRVRFPPPPPINGENEVLRLSPADRAIYFRAVDLLDSFNCPLNLAVAEYVEALKLLLAGTSLKEAVTDFRRRHDSVREARTVSEVVSLTHDVAKTVLEAGNSPTMIFRHFRELVTEDEAKAWFGVMPPAEATNVVPMLAAGGG